MQEERKTMTTAMDLSNALAGAVERAAGSLFSVHGRPRLPSTGVQWRAGLVVTANHTVEADHEVTITAPDGRTLSAQIIGREPRLDIAVLRAEVPAGPAADVGDDGELRIGHLVLAVGFGPRASAGIVSALDVRSSRHHVAGEMLAVDLTLSHREVSRRVHSREARGAQPYGGRGAGAAPGTPRGVARQSTAPQGEDVEPG